MAKVNPIIQWWITPKLPKGHIYFPREKRPKGFYQTIRVYSRKWLVHPIKRRVAKYYLLLLQKLFGLKVIAITGSAGKTTVKEMVLAILKSRGETVASYKNIDPVYNIPTTILKCSPRTKYLVLEFGVEFPDEMDFYLWLAKPSVGVVTNIYPTHIEFFKSIEGVAREKVKLIKSLNKDDYAVLNFDNSYTKYLAKETKASVVSYGRDGKVKANKVTFSKSFESKFELQIGKENVHITLPVLGKQFISNALAAASVGYALGFTLSAIKKGLQNYSRPEHRMKVTRLRSGALLFDDSYNNNPVAAKEALYTFKEAVGKKRKVIVFGDMLELGKHERKFHRELGKKIVKLGFTCFIGVGLAAKVTANEVRRSKKQVFWVNTEEGVDKLIKPYLKKENAIFVKGSRSVGLDRLVSRLLV